MSVFDQSAMPMCAVCKRPVAQFVMWHDALMQADVYEARCHGDVETVTVPNHLLMNAESISIGEAFSARKLANPEPGEG